MGKANSDISKANVSFRWTALAEIVSKLIAPVLNMVLARLISPEVFGIVATLSVITGLATTLSESGFARYVQQHQFSSDEERRKSNQTSLTSSLTFGILLFVIILIWRAPFAGLIGASGYEWYLVIAAGAVPFHSLIAVESAVLKKDFRFKITAFLRVGFAVVTAAIQILLAVFGQGLLALTLGSLVSSFALAVTLVFFLKDKRIVGFSWTCFKQSFTDNLFFLLEGLCIWLTSALDVLLLGMAFNDGIVGVYKLAFTTEKGIVAILGAIFSPVLITLLSKMSFEDENFKKALLSYQNAIAFIALPMGAGLFILRDGITSIFFGSGWEAAIPVFGYFALLDGFKICISDFISSLMIARGKPIGSVIAQAVYLGAITLCCVFAKQLGFDLFVLLRAGCTLILIAGYVVLCYPMLKISPWPFFKNLVAPLVGSLILACVCLPLSLLSKGIPTTLAAIGIGLLFYFVFMRLVFPSVFANFASIVFNKEAQANILDGERIEKRVTRIKRLHIIAKPTSQLYKAVLLSLLAIPIACSTALTASSHVAAEQFAMSFGLCKEAKQASPAGQSVLSVDFAENDVTSYRKFQSITQQFVYYKTNWPSLYNFYAEPQDQEPVSFRTFDEQQLEIAPFSLMTAHVVDYDHDDEGHPRFEMAGAYAMFERTETGIPHSSSNLFVSKSIADKLLVEGASYRDLLGKNLYTSSGTYHIANIVVPSKSSWLYDTLLNQYGDFAFVVDRRLLGNRLRYTSIFTQQPFEIYEYTSAIGTLCDEKTVPEASVSLVAKESTWSESESDSERLLNVLRRRNSGNHLSFNSTSILALIVLVILLSTQVFLAFFYMKKISHGGWSPRFLIPFAVAYVGQGGVYSLVAGLLLHSGFRFWLYYALTFGAGAIIGLIGAIIPLIVISHKRGEAAR